MKIVLLFGFIGIVASQVPRCNNQPPQWEAREFHFDSERKYETYGKLSYDAASMRWRHIEEVGNFTEREYLDRLYIHSTRTYYTLNLKTRNCTKRVADEGFHYRGVPPGSFFIGEGSIGAAGIPGEHTNVGFFNGTFEDKSAYTVTVTLPDCFVIASTVRSSSDPNGITVRNYFDMNVGIRDPNVFVPPQECL